MEEKGADMPTSIKAVIHGTVAVVLAITLGRLIGTGNTATLVGLLLLFWGLSVLFRYRTTLPAIAVAMCWYSGENVFFRLPYVTLVLAAFCGVTIFRHLLLRRREEERLFCSRSSRLGVAALMGMGAVLVAITFLRHAGVCPSSVYGQPGGLRHALTMMVLAGFTIMGMGGMVGTRRFAVIPVAALSIAVFNAVIDAANYINPRTAYLTNYIATSVNHEVTNVLAGGAESVLRISALRELGFYFAAFLLCLFVHQRNRAGRGSMPMYVLLGLLASALLVVVSGYRSYVIRYSVICVMVFWVYDRKWALASVAGIGTLWGGIVLLGRAISALPHQVQRVVGSIPGAYKTDIALGALSGIDWRADLFSRFFRYEFPLHPWFGRGVIGEIDLSFYLYLRDPVRYFEKAQLYHSGFASALDVVGVVGTSFLIVAQLIALRCCVILVRRHRFALNGWQWWCVLHFCASIPLYWYTGFFARQVPLLWLTCLGVYAANDSVVHAKSEAADEA